MRLQGVVCLMVCVLALMQGHPAEAACPPGGCNDGDPCTADTCVVGKCQYLHRADTCPSTGPCDIIAFNCATQTCVSATQVSTERCDDGNDGTAKDRCTPFGCVGTALQELLVGSKSGCAQIVVQDACEHAQCCEWSAGSCKPMERKRCADDGLSWTVGEICVPEGDDYYAKQGVPRCDDGNPCTRDWFDGTCHNPSYEELFAANGCPDCSLPCDDGNPCTVGDSCRGVGKMVCAGTPVTPPAIDPACATVVCDGNGGVETVPLAGAACEDGDPCKFNDHCDSTGHCVSGGSVQCDDGSPCTDDVCIAGLNLPGPGCQHLPTPGWPCDDGDLCSSSDHCFDGDCIGGSPTECNDGDVGTLDSCDPASGTCHHMPDPTLGDGHPDPSIPEPTLLLLFTPVFGAGGENLLELPHPPGQPAAGAFGACPPGVREYLLAGPRECPDGIGGPAKCDLVDRPHCVARLYQDTPNLLYRRGRGPTDVDSGAETLGDGLIALNAREFFPAHNPDPVARDWVGSLAVWIGLDAVHGVDGTRSVTILDSNVSRVSGVELPWRLAIELVPDKPLEPGIVEKRDQRRVLRLTAHGSQGEDLVLDASVIDWANGEWHHVAATWDADRVRLFTDGRLSVDVARPETFPTWEMMPDYLFLHGSARSHTGAYDTSSHAEVRLDALETFGRPLSVSEVAGLYRSQVPSSTVVLAGNLALELASPHDGLGLRSIYDMRDGRRVTAVAPSRQLWRLRLVPKADEDGFFSGSTAIDPKPAQKYPFSTFVTNTAVGEADLPMLLYNGDYWLVWNDIPLPEAGLFDSAWFERDFDLPDPPPPGTPDYPGHVTVLVKLSTANSESAVEARIEVFLHSSYWSLGEVAFPRLGGLGPPRGLAERTRLVLPDHTIGRTFRNPFACTGMPGACDGLAFDFAAHANSYPGRDLTMPWLGLYDEVEKRSGLYVGVEDPRARLKAFRLTRVLPSVAAAQAKANPPDPALDLDVDVIAEQVGTPGNDYDGFQLPTRIALQDGDWYDLAMRYRKFAVSAPWSSAGAPLAERTEFPPWLANAGLMQIGHQGDLTRLHCSRLAAMGAVPGLALFHYNRWDSANEVPQVQGQTNNTPFLWPTPDFDYAKVNLYADGRSTAFEAQLVTDCPASGGGPLVPGGPVVAYLNPTVWDAGRETSLSAEGENLVYWDYNQPAFQPGSTNYPGFTTLGHQAANKGTGSPFMPYEDLGPTSPDNKPDCRRLEPDYEMCPGSASWRDTIRSTIVQIGSYPSGLPGGAERHHRLAGVYLDMLATWAPPPCFSHGHGHAPGGGSWYVEYWTDILANAKATLRAIPGHGNAGFYSEGFSEPYISVVDGFFTQEDTLQDAVPLAMAVYHDRALFLGRYAAPASDADGQLAGVVAKQGQALAWGVVPGDIEGLTSAKQPLFDPVFSYMAHLARMRRQLAPFVLYGELRRPPTILWSEFAPDASCNPAAAIVSASIVAAPPPQAGTVPTEAIQVKHVQGSNVTWNRPSIEASAWRSPALRGAIVFAGLDVMQRQTVFVKIDGAELGLPEGPVVAHVVTLGADTCLGTLAGAGWVRVTLPSCAVAALEVVPGGGGCP